MKLPQTDEKKENQTDELIKKIVPLLTNGEEDILKMIKKGDKTSLYNIIGKEPEFKKLLNNEVANLEEKITDNALSKSQQYIDKMEYKNKLIGLNTIDEVDEEINKLLDNNKFNQYYDIKYKSLKKDYKKKLKEEPENVYVLLKGKYGVKVKSKNDKNNFNTLLDTLIKKKILYDRYGVNNEFLSSRGIKFNEREYIDDIEKQFKNLIIVEEKKQENIKKKDFIAINKKITPIKPYNLRSSTK